jgi:hypothetical protein
MAEGEVRKCRFCRVVMKFAGEIWFGISDTVGGWRLLFGEWAELGEDMVQLQDTPEAAILYKL